MAWITPSTGGTTYDGSLPDFDPIPVTLKEVTVAPDEKFGTGPRATLVWETIEPPGLSLMDWASIKLGKTQAGQVSKMRSLINAIEGRPQDAEVLGIDDSTLEYSLIHGELSGQVKPGVRVTVRGQNVSKDIDGETRQVFKIQHYFPVTTATGKHAAVKPASGKPTLADVLGKPAGKPAKPATEAVAEPALSSDF